MFTSIINSIVIMCSVSIRSITIITIIIIIIIGIIRLSITTSLVLLPQY